MANYDVTTAAASLEFDTQDNSLNEAILLDENHIVNFWSGVAGDGYAQVFTVNTTTWAITTANTSLEFDTRRGGEKSAVLVDENHILLLVYGSDGADSATQNLEIFAVNTTTFAITTANSRLVLDSEGGSNAMCQIDTNHFIGFWRGTGSDGYAQVFTVNTSTWALSTAAASLQFLVGTVNMNDCWQIDTNHFIAFFDDTGAGGGLTQVFTVNTTTWAVTTAAAAFNFDAEGNETAIYKIDTNHFIGFFQGVDNDGFAQVFTVNTSTWVVTTAAASLEFDTVNGAAFSVQQVDTNHFLTTWAGSGDDGFIQVFTVNTTTWAITTAAARLEFDTTQGLGNSLVAIDSSHFANFWQGTLDDGYAQTFAVELASVTARSFGFIF